MSISACMIVKDESKVLTRCLSSIKDWVDEIIVVDTGSTDGTVDIAKSFGAKVYHKKWTNDFSFHRNHSMNKATKDWIFIIDADEEVPVEDGIVIKKMLDDGIEYDVIGVDVLSIYGKEKIAKTRLPMLRFFRRSYGPRYSGFVHNRPVIKDSTPIYRLPFRILHYGYDLDEETMERKYQRTLKMCRKATMKDPDDIIMWLHYAHILKVRKKNKFNEEQIPEMERALLTGIGLCDAVNDNQNIYIQLLAAMSLVQYKKKDYKAAVKYGELALSHKQDFLDALYLTGMAYVYGIDALRGEAYLRRYLVEQETYDFSGKMDSIVMEFASVRGAVYRSLAEVEDWKDRELRIVPVKVEQEALQEEVNAQIV